MREILSKETLRLLQEIEESTKEILEEAEKEIRSMAPEKRMELFGVAESPFFDDPIWEEFFPSGSDEDSEEEF